MQKSIRTSPSRTKKEVKSHLQGIGYKFGLTHASRERKLAQLMGDARYFELSQVASRRMRGEASSRDIYKIFETAAEFHMAFSEQSEVSVDAYSWIVGELSELSLEDTHIVDFGCASGSLLSFLASRFPRTHFTGIDREEHLCKIAKVVADFPNTEILCWDYSTKGEIELRPVDVAICSIGLDFEIDGRTELDESFYREGIVYEGYKEVSKAALENWRTHMVAGGVLFAILRLGCVRTFFGFCDAAIEAGWTIDFENSTKVISGEEQLPAFVLIADATEKNWDDEILSLWLDRAISRQFSNVYDDALANVLYQSLPNRTAVKRYERTYDDLHTMRCELGFSGPFSYLYVRATTGYCKLQLDSRLNFELQQERVTDHLKGKADLEIDLPLNESAQD